MKINKTKPSNKVFALAILAISLTRSVIAQEAAVSEPPAPESTLLVKLATERPQTVTNFVTLMLGREERPSQFRTNSLAR